MNGKFKEESRQINLVIKFILKWEWKLTANNLIDIDFKLVPAVRTFIIKRKVIILRIILISSR